LLRLFLGKDPACSRAIVTAPRQILPNSFYEITRRSSQRQFLMVPDDEIKNAYIYCLAEAAQRFDIMVMLGQLMSNHHHTECFDLHGNISAFMQRFHSHFAKCVNLIRGRKENCWASTPPCATKLLDRSTVLSKLAYAALNPVKAHLVARVADWPLDMLRALVDGKPIRATRPRFFRANGPMPAEVELKLEIPDVLDHRELLLAELQRRVAEVEQESAEQREKTGRRVVGRHRILRQNWRSAPTTEEPKRTLRPRFASLDMWKRIDALQGYRAFLREYREARAASLRGIPVVFPAGTYWLRRVANVQVASATVSPIFE
jgi:hypothetical protein